MNGVAQVRFPLYDAHGNSVATLGRSGSSWTLGDERAYDAWGRVRQGGQTGAPSSRYCASIGHVQDDESGLVYMRARHYEASTGRFVSEDPACHGNNWYSYCSNNPANRSDFTGKYDEATGYYAAGLALAVLRLTASRAKLNGGLAIVGIEAGLRSVGAVCAFLSIALFMRGLEGDTRVSNADFFGTIMLADLTFMLVLAANLAKTYQGMSSFSRGIGLMAMAACATQVAMISAALVFALGTPDVDGEGN